MNEDAVCCDKNRDFEINYIVLSNINFYKILVKKCLILKVKAIFFQTNFSLIYDFGKLVSRKFTEVTEVVINEAHGKN